MPEEQNNQYQNEPKFNVTDEDLATSFLLRSTLAKSGVLADPENEFGAIIEARFETDMPIGTLEKLQEHGAELMSARRPEAGGPMFVRARVNAQTHDVRAMIQTAKQQVEAEKANPRPENPRLRFITENLKRSPAMMAFLKGNLETGRDISAPRKNLIFHDYDRTIIESTMDKVPENLGDELRTFGASKWAQRQNDDGTTSLKVEFDVPYHQARYDAYDALGFKLPEKPRVKADPNTKPFILFCDELGVLEGGGGKGHANMRDFVHEMAEEGVRIELVSISQYGKMTLSRHGWGDSKYLKDFRHSTWHIPDFGYSDESNIKKYIDANKEDWLGWIEIKDDRKFIQRYDTPEAAKLHGMCLNRALAYDKSAFERIRGLIKEQVGPTFGMNHASTYNFAEHEAEGIDVSKAVLGGKGAGLMNMANQGMPVPPGFVTTTNVCGRYLHEGELPEQLADDMAYSLTKVENQMGQKFGDAQNPLLLSVRSGAPVSMPGMMETVLNIGMNDEIAEAQSASMRGDGRFAFDCYRRLIESYGAAVNHIDARDFKASQAKVLEAHGLKSIGDADEAVLRGVVEAHKKLYFKKTGEPFPQNVWAQLGGANEAVFKSWDSDRCQSYRRANDIPKSLYTAATTQAMVFGNRNERSGSGVLFTRDPNTGERKLTGQWLSNCQGEDVVSGRFKTESIETLAQKMPEVYEELKQHVEFLEATEKDVQDVEFTIDNGRLYLLQTRDAKRSPEAAIKIAADMAREGIIEKATAVDRAKELGVGNLVNMELDKAEIDEAELKPIAEGMAVCSGAVNGVAVFDVDQAEDQRNRGNNPIVFAEDSLTEDIELMQNANGMVVFGGNEASHAAVVARGMGLPYVCDLPEPETFDEKYVRLEGGTKLKVGEEICLDAVSGRIYKGHLPLKQKDISADLEQLAQWDYEIAEEECETPQLYEALERVRNGEPEYENVLQEAVWGTPRNRNASEHEHEHGHGEHDYEDDGSAPWHECNEYSHCDKHGPRSNKAAKNKNGHEDHDHSR